MNEDGNLARRHISCHEKPKLNDNNTKMRFHQK